MIIIIVIIIIIIIIIISYTRTYNSRVEKIQYLIIKLPNAWWKIINQMSTRNESFLARVNKKQSVETDSPDSRRGQGKYTTHAVFSWSAFEAVPAIFNASLCY